MSLAGFDQITQAIRELGFPIVIAVLLLLLLRYVIQDAVAHFNQRLDYAALEQSASFRELSGAVRHLDTTLDRLADQSSANHEALTNLLMFMSHTQQEVVAHRTAVETIPPVAPSTPITVPSQPVAS